MWQSLLIIAHVVIAASLVGLILLQQGKGANAGAAFGAGASGTVFGARGSSSFLSRASGILATLFMGTSLTLAYFQGEAGQVATGVMQQRVEETTEAPMLLPGEDDLTDLPALPEGPSSDNSSLPELPAGDDAPSETPVEAPAEDAPTD